LKAIDPLKTSVAMKSVVAVGGESLDEAFAGLLDTVVLKREESFTPGDKSYFSKLNDSASLYLRHDINVTSQVIVKSNSALSNLSVFFTSLFCSLESALKLAKELALSSPLCLVFLAVFCKTPAVCALLDFYRQKFETVGYDFI
jgi:hypothetical protein